MIMNSRSMAVDFNESADTTATLKNPSAQSIPRKRPENLSPFISLNDPRVKLSVDRARPKARYPNLAPPRSNTLNKPVVKEDPKAELIKEEKSTERQIQSKLLEEDPSLYIVQNLPKGIIDALASLKTPPDFINKVMTKAPVFLAGNKNPQLKRKLEPEPETVKPAVHTEADPYFSRDPLPNTTHLVKAQPAVQNFPLYDPTAQPSRRIVSCSDAATLPVAPMGSILPCYHSKDHKIPLITPQTMKQVLDGCYNDFYHDLRILDCRFDYEFNGGRISGAMSFSDPRKLPNLILSADSKHAEDRINLMIIYCEYSMDRSPKIAQKLRNLDETFSKLKRGRENARGLKYPELYILDGGYANFYEAFSDRCEPRGYTPMDCKEHRSDMAKSMLTFNHRLDRLGLNLARSHSKPIE